MAKLKSVEAGFKGKRVLVTGHTGFKGAWLSLYLSELGAEVYGYSLEINKDENLYTIANVESLVNHQIGDVRSGELYKYLEIVKPDYIFHLAAQALVIDSYNDPMETITTNVIGTANLLDCIRRLNRKCNVVVVTTDKCYDNTGSLWGYKENDPMGGKDPYSMSKGCAELVTSSFRTSYFDDASEIRVASARAGNVIGGGDFSKNRIIPDLYRSVRDGNNLTLRYPDAVRPWQHVLEPVYGYLRLALSMDCSDDKVYRSAFNFGPNSESCVSVEDLVSKVVSSWDAIKLDVITRNSSLEEASYLTLNVEKAYKVINWRPLMTIDQCVGEVVDWYAEYLDKSVCMRDVSLQQIRKFRGLVSESGGN